RSGPPGSCTSAPSAPTTATFPTGRSAGHGRELAASRNRPMHVVRREEYDAVVVGSGIAGGWAAKELTEKGLRTLVIERGRNVEHGKDYITEHKPTWQLPLRNERLSVGTKGAERYPTQARAGQFHEAVKHFFINDRRHPTIEARPSTWFQGDKVGGKWLSWGRRGY